MPAELTNIHKNASFLSILQCCPMKRAKTKTNASSAKIAALKCACMTCHTLDKDGPNKVGPNLWGVVDRPRASHPDYDYSAATKAKGGKWTFSSSKRLSPDERLDAERLREHVAAAHEHNQTQRGLCDAARIKHPVRRANSRLP
jgi:hypothetical protein